MAKNKPSPRMVRAFEKAVLAEKPVPVAVAMREAGYSPESAKNPQLFTRSAAWLTLMENYGLSDKDLAKRHKELLDSNNENIAVKALDIGYKVSGKYNNTSGTTFNAPVQINIGVVDDPTTPQDTAE